MAELSAALEGQELAGFASSDAHKPQEAGIDAKLQLQRKTCYESPTVMC